MKPHTYTLADLQQQQETWAQAVAAYRIGHTSAIETLFLCDADEIDRDQWVRLVSLATLGACLTGQVFARRGRDIQPGARRFVVQLADEQHEPPAVTRVAAQVVEDAANGRLLEVAQRVNVWGSFDAHGIDRMQELLVELLEMYCGLEAA